MADIHHIVFTIGSPKSPYSGHIMSATPSLTCEFHMLVLLSVDECILEDLCSADDHV